MAQEWEQKGNKLKSSVPKWGKNGNKVKTRLPTCGENANKWEQNGKQEFQSMARMGAKCKHGEK